MLGWCGGYCVYFKRRGGKLVFFFFKQKTAYEFSACLVGSEMCIRVVYFRMYVRAYVRYVRTYVRSYVLTYVRTYVRTYVYYWTTGGLGDVGLLISHSGYSCSYMWSYWCCYSCRWFDG